MNNFDELWDRFMGRDVTPAQYAADGWNASRVLSDLREMWGNHPTDAATDAELLTIAYRIASGLVARGWEPTTPRD